MNSRRVDRRMESASDENWSRKVFGIKKLGLIYNHQFYIETHKNPISRGARCTVSMPIRSENRASSIIVSSEIKRAEPDSEPFNSLNKTVPLNRNANVGKLPRHGKHATEAS